MAKKEGTVDASKKRTARKKMGQRALSNRTGDRKRMPKLRLPRNGSKKWYVVALFHNLNSLKDNERAECLNELRKYMPKQRSASAANDEKLFKALRKLMNANKK
jgi:hypothetical protein